MKLLGILAIILATVAALLIPLVNVAAAVSIPLSVLGVGLVYGEHHE